MLPDGSLQFVDLGGRVFGEIQHGVFVPAMPPHASMPQQSTGHNGTAQTNGQQPLTKKGAGESSLSLAEIQPYLSANYAPRFNVRTQQVEVKGEALEPQDIRAFHQRMAMEGLRTSSATEVKLALEAVAGRRPYDPVIEAMANLPEPMDRLDLLAWWMEVLHLEEKWEAEIWLCWAIGAMEKLYAPGQLLKCCPVLVGRNDLRKSTFVRELALGFGGVLSLDQGELALTLTAGRQWIWELSEIDQIKQWGWGKAKDWLARPTDNFVPKYSNQPVERHRNFCLIGTTNSTGLVTDPNAATRLPCFQIREVIDTDRVRAEAPAMWAGVLALHRVGHSSQPSERLIKAMEARQKENQGEDPLRDRIEDYLAMHNPKEVTLVELGFHCLEIRERSRFDKKESLMVSRALADIGGWAKKKDRPEVMNPWEPSGKKVRATAYVRV